MRSPQEEEIALWERIGPEAVRLQLMSGALTGSAAHRASRWLGPKDEEAQRQTQRLAEAASRHASRANLIAIIAAVIAGLALLVSLFKS